MMSKEAMADYLACIDLYGPLLSIRTKQQYLFVMNIIDTLGKAPMTEGERIYRYTQSDLAVSYENLYHL